MTDSNIAYFILRITLGINLFFHGVTRFSSYSAFVESTTLKFKDTFIPSNFVNLFAQSLPPLETLIGFLLIFGFCTRFAATLGALLIAVLVFGSSLLMDWNVVGFQMIYAMIYYFLIMNRRNNSISLDALINRLH